MLILLKKQDIDGGNPYLTEENSGLTLVVQNIREGVQVRNCMRLIMRCAGLGEPPCLNQQFYLAEPRLCQFSPWEEGALRIQVGGV